MRVPVGALGLALMAVGAVLLFVLSVLAARRARRPRVAAPPKRSFERGRNAALRAGVLTEADAVRALSTPPVASFVDARQVPGGWMVSYRRKRNEACAVVAGYVTGLFEAAWARDVIVRHEGCGGRSRGAVCVYEVRDPMHHPHPPGAPHGGHGLAGRAGDGERPARGVPSPRRARPG